MKTFEQVDVNKIADALAADMEKCALGEGDECNTLERKLLHFAAECDKFSEQIRQWARDVFGGRVEFKADAERAWRERGIDIYLRAQRMLVQADDEEDDPNRPCVFLSNKNVLQTSADTLHVLVTWWLRPHLAVSPSARQGMNLTPAEEKVVRDRLASLPPLAADWEPANPEQRERFRRLRQKTA